MEHLNIKRIQTFQQLRKSLSLSVCREGKGVGLPHIDFPSLHIFPFFVSLYAFYIVVLLCSFVTEKSREGFLIFLGGNFLPLANTELRKTVKHLIPQQNLLYGS